MMLCLFNNDALLSKISIIVGKVRDLYQPHFTKRGWDLYQLHFTKSGRDLYCVADSHNDAFKTDKITQPYMAGWRFSTMMLLG
jgi:hypothetical protein